MKTELVDVNETRKNLRVEIPSDIVDAKIDRIASQYSRKARVPGFRPGRVPPRVVKQRYRDQILHDVAQDLIPPAVDEALRTRGVQAVDIPDIRDVNVDEGQALTFTASFDTLPAFDPGEYSTLSVRQRPPVVDDEALEEAMRRLTEQAARLEPVEGRGVSDGDTVTLDIERRQIETSGPDTSSPVSRSLDSHQDVVVELGGKANPPGFDEQLLGLEAGAQKTFVIHYPADHQIRELADTDVEYSVTVNALRRRILPTLDDDFAKDLGTDTLEALRKRVREDLEVEARRAADHQVRTDLMKQLAARLPFEAPDALIEREVDRRLEDFAHRLMEQNVDPRQAGIDWAAFRDSQRAAAREAVAGSIVLDEVARREHIEVSDEELESEIARHAERVGRTPAAVRAALEKERGLAGIRGGLRREKTFDFVLSRATILRA